MNTKEEVKSKGELKRELGLFATTAIVIGNMIGSGVFMAPASLAAASNPKAILIAWTITSIGSILIAMSFANLGSVMPKTGGPIVYTRAAFGDFPAFLIAWTYWIGCWVGNAAIITGFMSYFIYFVPAANNPLIAFLVTSAVLWIFTTINVLGTKEAGIVGVITTVMKVAILVVFIAIASIKFNPNFLNTVSDVKNSGMSTLPAAIAVTLWSFMGLESATLPAGEIKNPERNIKLSTIIGTIITSIIYILISFVAMGSMSQSSLAKSTAPLADIINAATGGTWGGNFIAFGAVISTLGAMSGWILTAGRSGYAAAKDNLFPTAFGRVHQKYNTPASSLIISGVCTNLLLIMNYIGSLRSAFDFMILLATLSFLPAYLFSIAAEIILVKKHGKQFNFWNFAKNSFISLIAFGYTIYAIYGTGSEVVMYGFLLMLLGIPFYLYMMLQNNKKDKKIDILRKQIGLSDLQ